MGVGTRLLSEDALEGGACRTIGRYLSLFITEEAAWWAATYSAARKTGKVHSIPIVMVDVACRSGRWGLGGRRRLSGCSGCCGWGGNSGHGSHRRGRGSVSSNLLVGFFQILL